MHESIMHSPKTFFPLDLIQALARKKHKAGALLTDPVAEAMLLARVWKQTQDSGRRTRKNWYELHEVEIPGSRLNLMLEARYGAYFPSVQKLTDFLRKGSSASARAAAGQAHE